MDKLELEKVKAVQEYHGRHKYTCACHDHVPKLIAQVESLQGQLVEYQQSKKDWLEAFACGDSVRAINRLAAETVGLRQQLADRNDTICGMKEEKERADMLHDLLKLSQEEVKRLENALQGATIRYESMTKQLAEAKLDLEDLLGPHYSGLRRENEDLKHQLAQARKALPKGLNIRCCEDGVWLELKADTGISACMNLSDMGKCNPGNIISVAILEWCRQTAAK